VKLSKNALENYCTCPNPIPIPTGMPRDRRLQEFSRMVKNTCETENNGKKKSKKPWNQGNRDNHQQKAPVGTVINHHYHLRSNNNDRPHEPEKGQKTKKLQRKRDKRKKVTREQIGGYKELFQGDEFDEYI
jgi:hypothetical protein